MSVMRIHQLAKELGVENKIIIAKAKEFGMQGKNSHSSSITAEETDTLRRYFLREAVSANAAEIDRQSIKTSVDSSTGEQKTIVESRKGNVIRRRKASDDTSTTATNSLSSSNATNSVSVNVAMEEAESSNSSSNIFNEVVDQEDAVQLHAGQQHINNQNQSESELLVSEQNEQSEELEEAVSAENETNSNTIHNNVNNDLDLSSANTSANLNLKEEINTAEKISKYIEPEPVQLDVETAPQIAVSKNLSDVGPKILGKIELSQPATGNNNRSGGGYGQQNRNQNNSQSTSTDRNANKQKEGLRGLVKGTGAFTTIATNDFSEDDASGKKGDKKKKKFVEFSRGDLVDYDARFVRKKNAGKNKKDSALDEAKDSDNSQVKAPKKPVKITEDGITVGDFAHQMSLKVGEVISKLIQFGVMATINQVIDKDTATIMAEEFGYTVEVTGFDEGTIIQIEGIDNVEQMTPRPPVVTVMGHVDHGKTSLLDYIRKTSVTAKEHGGITQHIGAYTVQLKDGRKIAFLDTPGHAAFTQMRARGAQITDVVILVVAADDGVMPQTVEALNHAKAAGVTIVVAMNKMDKPEAQPDRIKQQLSEYGIQPEEWGGDSIFVPVSAKSGAGIEDLLDSVLLVAEVKELKANPSCRSKGTIIEVRQEIGRGTVVTVLVQHGTLKIGDLFIAGSEWGRVRSMSDHNGNKLTEATPSTPVEITGISGAPLAGDDFVVVLNENQAKQVSAARTLVKVHKEHLALAGGPISLEEFSKKTSEAQATDLNIIIKADVHGSLEAVKESVSKLSNDEVRVKIVHSAVGGVNESDVQLALASKAIILGFGVRGEPRALAEAENSGIEVRFYRIIYELIDDIKAALGGLLKPTLKENVLGHIEIRQTFSVPKAGTVAGCYVLDGQVKRGSKVRLLRDNRVIHEGKMSSLKRFKDDVKEVQSGYECGLSVENYNDIKVGDVLEVFEIEEIARTL